MTATRPLLRVFLRLFRIDQRKRGERRCPKLIPLIGQPLDSTAPARPAHQERRRGQRRRRRVFY